ncbi:hypothetical protein EHR01_06395 [Leptospira mtsangambouensis]|uniref:Uncharacterized protein n=1 Tax=Leptospira mtsangambouensis TaxID=2484912 RepID=A0ABY2P4P8_9LEPT|nr:hypothetical protein [Leptospira mtsangambouensis]TGM82406.1 hypothetical protein EHR01_06395 [Leptospira mtsangambouensis]
MDMLILAADQVKPDMVYGSLWYQDPLLIFLLTILGIIVSVIGSLFSWSAYKAANKAGHIVKVQDILIEVTELTEKCHLKSNVSFEQASELLHTLSSKNHRVITIFTELISKSDNNLISELNSAFENARGKLDTLNPVINPGLLTTQPQITDQLIYYTMEAEFSKIGQKLNKLKAVLEKNTAAGGDI